MKFQIHKIKCRTLEKVFVLLLTISLLFLTYKSFSSEITLLQILIYFLLVFLFFILAFLAYYDFKKMEVHNSISFVLMITLVVINAVLFFVYKDKLDINIFGDWVYNPYNNMIGALILGTLFQLIVLISKEKALGQGDVRMGIISGLLVGYSNLISWGYITVFSALFYGLILSIKEKRIKGLKIPLLPFITLSIILILLASI